MTYYVVTRWDTDIHDESDRDNYSYEAVFTDPALANQYLIDIRKYLADVVASWDGEYNFTAHASENLSEVYTFARRLKPTTTWTVDAYEEDSLPEELAAIL